MDSSIISALTGAFGTIASAIISAKISKQDEPLDASNRITLIILVGITSLLVGGMIVYLSYDSTKWRIKASLGKNNNYKRIIYEKVGLGFLIPYHWKIDDSAFKFGGGEIMLRRDYNPQTNRVIQGIQFNYVNIQDIYIKNFNDEIKNHITNFQEIGAKIFVKDVTFSEKKAKLFCIKQPLPMGKERDIEMTWVYITPFVKFVVSSFSEAEGKALRDFKSERDIIIQSLVLDDKKISELSTI